MGICKKCRKPVGEHYAIYKCVPWHYECLIDHIQTLIEKRDKE